MIRYSFITILLLLAAFALQPFLPPLTGLHYARIFIVQLVFLCGAVTVGMRTMLLLAFIAGFLWDAQCVLLPRVPQPDVYVQAVESLRFGYSILLFGVIGFLMQGLQPLFRQGKWQFSVLLSGVALFLYLAAEYAIINFVRGDFVLSRATLMQMTFSSLLTMLFSPLVFWLLYHIARSSGHSIHPEAGRRRSREF